MKKLIPLFALLFFTITNVSAQLEPNAGSWKTWFISSGKDHRLTAPTTYKNEIAQVIAKQQQMDAAGMQQILYWNAGSPGYRWQDMMSKLWMTDAGYDGALSYMLIGAATYDAIVAAWDTKYAYKRPRPFEVDKRIRLYAGNPQSPSYPCEHSVAAGVAVTIISHFFPKMADSANKMARQVMESRIAAGIAFPSDTESGFALGKKIAESEIEFTKSFTNKTAWDGKMPTGPAYWRGKDPSLPLAGNNKTVVLTSGNQFRPAPPPDFAKDMAELKNFKQTFRSQSNAFYYASQPTTEDMLNKKMFEYNIHFNAPRAARMYAITGIAIYDGFIACWDAKYAYWGIRPDQYDTTYKPLLPTPPFPGYPSGHATVGALIGEVFSYFFPADRALFQRRAKDGAESRFQGGIHFRTDNEAGLELGRKVAAAIIQKVKTDGAD